MNVLFLTHRLPYAPNRGDRLRAFYIIRMLRAQGANVDVLSLVHDSEEEAQVDRMRRELGVDATALHVPRLRNYATGALSLAGTQPLTHVLLNTEWARALGVLQRRGGRRLAIARAWPVRDGSASGGLPAGRRPG
jgi:hypothetical protein